MDVPPKRNDLCNCDSGKKYKRCCLPQEEKISQDFTKIFSEQFSNHPLAGVPLSYKEAIDFYQEQIDFVENKFIENNFKKSSCCNNTIEKKYQIFAKKKIEYLQQLQKNCVNKINSY